MEEQCVLRNGLSWVLVGGLAYICIKIQIQNPNGSMDGNMDVDADANENSDGLQCNWPK